MNKTKLRSVFKKIKDEAGLAYAIIDIEKYGDCVTCASEGLASEFGVDSNGIFCKSWRHNGNRTTFLEKAKAVYIAHDITPEQATIVMRLFKENGYFLESDKYNSKEAMRIAENPFI